MWKLQRKNSNKFLILTNVPRSFQNTCVLETGLPDFHLMALTVLRKRFKKFKPGVIHYRSYKHFSNILEKLVRKALKGGIIGLFMWNKEIIVLGLFMWNKEIIVLLIRKTKEMYCSNVDEKNVTDNKRFWKTVKLSDKPTD